MMQGNLAKYVGYGYECANMHLVEFESRYTRTAPAFSYQRGLTRVFGTSKNDMDRVSSFLTSRLVVKTVLGHAWSFTHAPENIPRYFIKCG